MSLRFAAARPAVLTSYLPRAEVTRMAARAANDNGDDQKHQAAMRAALKHFASHGMAAAGDARDRARKAHFSGDRQGYLHWLAICRMLDRRMAVALASNLAKRRP
ncbi:MAG TPA: hypothetical protein PK680_10270 [Novosphingobium sp.]|nr:hypothetical protein [Novosphingobium sp.]HQA18753.1 hypothetical protein [Novosphingobium sp.]